MNQVPWLTSTDQVPQASDDALRRSLLTCDGRGVNLKKSALDELLKRAQREAGQ